MHQIDPEAHLRGFGQALPAGALLADPQHIPKQHEYRHGHQRYIGAVVIIKDLHQLPPLPGEQGRPAHGDRRPQRAQQIERKFRRPAERVLLQIVAQHVVPYIAQDQMQVQIADPKARRLAGPQAKQGGQPGR